MFLWKFEGECEATFFLVLYGLLDKGVHLGSKSLNCGLRTSKGYNCARGRHSHGNLVCISVLLFLLDVAAEFFMESKAVSKN
jgi:hypothetical protein